MSASLLLLIFGVWLILQSTVGELPARLLSFREGLGDPGRFTGTAGTAVLNQVAALAPPKGTAATPAQQASASAAGAKPASNAEARAQGMLEWRGVTLAPAAMGQWAALVRAAESAGLTITGSGWRSTQRQKELRVINGCPDVCCAPSSSCRVPTARPGTSKHERGLAVDVKNCSYSSANYRWLKANAGRYGFSATVRGESWHWSLGGG